MSPKQTRDAINSQGGTSVIARTFKIDIATVKRAKRRGCAGEREILLRLLTAGKITRQDIEATHK